MNTVENIDALSGLKKMADKSVHCCVTSPPYFGLRDYNVDGQLGLEATPELYVEKMVEIFREVKRVLRDDGSLWLNIGDSYAAYKANTGDTDFAGHSGRPEHKRGWQYGSLKPKDLIGIPWMLAFALRADGWYLRQDIIWSKPNPMPESVTDRCTKAHEYLFLLSKSQKYYYDAEAIKTPIKDSTVQRMLQQIEQQAGSDRVPGKTNGPMKAVGPGRIPRKGVDTNGGNQATETGIPAMALNGNGVKGHSGNFDPNGELIGDGMANKRSVWEVPTMPFKSAHFATFSERLIVDCIKAGSSECGCCSLCGAPYIREFTKELIPRPKASFNSKADSRDFDSDPNDQGSNRMKDGHKPGWVNRTETTGWQPTCSCGASIVPSVVLDPFMGAFTTALVARKLVRNYAGFELNPEYVKIGNARLVKELGFLL